MNEVFLNMGDDYKDYFLDYIIVKLMKTTDNTQIYDINTVLDYFE